MTIDLVHSTLTSRLTVCLRRLVTGQLSDQQRRYGYKLKWITAVGIVRRCAWPWMEGWTDTERPAATPAHPPAQRVAAKVNDLVECLWFDPRRSVRTRPLLATTTGGVDEDMLRTSKASRRRTWFRRRTKWRRRRESRGRNWRTMHSGILKEQT